MRLWWRRSHFQSISVCVNHRFHLEFLHCTVTNFFCSMMLLRFTNRRCISCGEENESQVWSELGGPWLDRHWKLAFRSIAGIGVALKLNNVARLWSRPLCVYVRAIDEFLQLFILQDFATSLKDASLVCVCSLCCSRSGEVSLFCSQILFISFSSHLQV